MHETVISVLYMCTIQWKISESESMLISIPNKIPYIFTKTVDYYHVTITWYRNFRINKNDCINCKIATISTEYRPTLLILRNKINFTLHEKCWEKVLRIKENGWKCIQRGILFNFRQYARNYCIRERVSICAKRFSHHFSFFINLICK